MLLRAAHAGAGGSGVVVAAVFRVVNSEFSRVFGSDGAAHGRFSLRRLGRHGHGGLRRLARFGIRGLRGLRGLRIGRRAALRGYGRVRAFAHAGGVCRARRGRGVGRLLRFGRRRHGGSSVRRPNGRSDRGFNRRFDRRRRAGVPQAGARQGQAGDGQLRGVDLLFIGQFHGHGGRGCAQGFRRSGSLNTLAGRLRVVCGQDAVEQAAHIPAKFDAALNAVSGLVERVIANRTGHGAHVAEGVARAFGERFPGDAQIGARGLQKVVGVVLEALEFRIAGRHGQKREDQAAEHRQRGDAPQQFSTHSAAQAAVPDQEQAHRPEKDGNDQRQNDIAIARAPPPGPPLLRGTVVAGALFRAHHVIPAAPPGKELEVEFPHRCHLPSLSSGFCAHGSIPLL